MAGVVLQLLFAHFHWRSFDNELDSIEDEGVSTSQTEENQINIESQENTLPLESSEGGDEAINCNWNIKVINILLSF